jgi:CRISPR-associated protein Cas1
MKTLYVKEQGACIRRSGQRLLVYKGEQALETVRLRDLERLVLLGSIEISASALAALLESGIETVLLSFHGKFRGRLFPAEGRNVFLRLEQFRRYEDGAFRLKTARAIVAGKIRNARVVLQRHQRNHPSEALLAAMAHLERSRESVAAQDSLDTLLGVEGNAARTYFAAFGGMVRSEFTFTTRSRRPPRDPVNALLSFGYTLLSTELTGATAAQGLDPYVGVLHELDYGRPSLALDLLEEFRQPVVDRLALSLINRMVLQRSHFDDRGEAGVLLNDEGRIRFLDFYHRALETPFEEGGASVTYRDLLLRQAGRMREALMTAGDYVPFSPH